MEHREQWAADRAHRTRAWPQNRDRRQSDQRRGRSGRTAWRVFREDFNRPLKLVKPRPARNGWDESREYDYETSPNERIIVSGRALRHGEAWTAVLFELGQAPFERRLAQIVLVSDSLRPKGYAKESFAGRTANPLDAERLKRIADMVERGRNALDIPGVAISLVQGGKVVFAGG